jgi:hypothetical protein
MVVVTDIYRFAFIFAFIATALGFEPICTIWQKIFRSVFGQDIVVLFVLIAIFVLMVGMSIVEGGICLQCAFGSYYYRDKKRI